MSSPSARRPCNRDVRLRLIGPLALVGPSASVPLPQVPRGRASTLLGLLAAHRNRVVGMHTIIDTLWPDGAPPSAVQTVAALISRLRRLVGQCLDRVGAGYRLDTTGWRVDLDEAAHLVMTAERHLAGGEPTLGQVAARSALDLLSAGQAAEGFPSAPWTEQLEHEVERLLRRARHAVWSAAPRLGDHRQSAEAAAAALRADPYDESACRALIRAQSALGSPGAALLTFEALRHRLRTELGADPDPRTTALHQAVLGGRRVDSPDGDDSIPAAGKGACGSLVGRQEELARLHTAWRSAVTGRRTVVVVRGAAGMGTTALLSAFARQVEQQGAAVLQVQCAQGANLLGVSALTQAVARYCGTARPQEVEEDTAGLEQPLRERIPEIQSLLDPAHATAQGGSGASGSEPDAVTAFILRTAARRPLLLTVDDAHVAAGATLAALRHLYAAAHGHRLLLLVAAGQDGVPAGLLPITSHADHLAVEPLPADAVAELATRRAVPEAAADLLRLTAGRPALLVEALVALRAGSLPMNPEELADGLPDGLARVARDLVHRLGEPVADLLRQAALIGPRFRFDEVLEVSGLPGREAARRLHVALRAGVLLSTGEALVFAGAALYAALSTGVPTPLRAALKPPRRPHPAAGAGTVRGRRPILGRRHPRRIQRCGCRPR
ncbi:BTAD domain-containing putative transcriptional regulator [Streptomyces sp. NPDC058964]|uniref:BTAD domain-containing putative transcriptional regulator n=1 Tax=Streptomyces sp. NPDC058964 TaxID=3346681 RepID=UPI0036738156